MGAFTPGAAGDAVYHTQHMTIEAVGDAPLRSGFVNNIKANGPRVYAHEIYVLNGARPRTTYTVTNHFVVGDPNCDRRRGTALTPPSSRRCSRQTAQATGAPTSSSGPRTSEA